MLQIRLGAFETNSSSIHSFYIRKDFKPEPSKIPICLVAHLDFYGRRRKRHPNSDFLSYCWTAIVTHFNLGRSWKLGDKTLCKRQKEALKWKNKISKLLESYNVFVQWQHPLIDNEKEDDQYYVEHAGSAMRLIEDLLQQPDLFLSAVLCEKSYFYSGGDEMKSWKPPVNNREGYEVIVNEN